MIDIVGEIEAVQREVGEGTVPAGAGRSVRLQREYDAPIEDVWDALTNPERIGRWFLPISGRLSPRWSLPVRGQRRGRIVACEQPHRLRVTWEYGRRPARRCVVLELRLSSADGGVTRLELEHTAVVPDEMWTEYGPGAVGVGWEQGLLGLALHLRGGSVGDSTAWQLRPRDAISRAGAARHGETRTWPRAPIRSGRAGSREHDRVLRARSGGNVLDDRKRTWSAGGD